MLTFIHNTIRYFFFYLLITLFSASYINDRLIKEGELEATNKKAIWKIRIIAAEIALVLGLIGGVLSLIEDFKVTAFLFTFTAIILVSTTAHNYMENDKDNQTKILVQTKRLLYHATFWIGAFLFGGLTGNDGETIILVLGLPIAFVIGGLEKIDSYGGYMIAAAIIFIVSVALSFVL